MCVCCVKSRVSSFSSYKTEPAAVLSRFSRFFFGRSFFRLRRYQKCGAVQGAFCWKRVDAPPLARFFVFLLMHARVPREPARDHAPRVSSSVELWIRSNAPGEKLTLVRSLVFTTPMMASKPRVFWCDHFGRAIYCCSFVIVSIIRRKK